jgi:hypothetical protein
MDAKTFHQDEHRLSNGRPLWGKNHFMMAYRPFKLDMVDEYKMMSNRLQPTSCKVRDSQCRELRMPCLGHDGGIQNIGSGNRLVDLRVRKFSQIQFFSKFSF